MASYGPDFLRQCNPGFKSWEEPTESRIDELALKVLKNYYDRKHNKRPAGTYVDWNQVEEKLTGKKTG